MSNAAFDPDSFKAATRTQWDHSGEGWNEQTRAIRAWLEDATRLTLDRARVEAGARFLDVAAGAAIRPWTSPGEQGPQVTLSRRTFRWAFLPSPKQTRLTQG